ncbi:MAG TPA: PAS domain S-box protein, partial [Desulfosalsimonadaceae bacterium]|nr:PAS domain S-box protein [Desulfosalsimonadaceae bacterium]
ESTGRDLHRMVREVGRNPKHFITNQNQNICKDGRRVWVAWTNKAVYDESGQLREILCIGNDITEFKQAEKTLNFQSLLLNQIQDCITATDLDGNITYVNEAEVQRMQRSREELLGRSVTVYGEDPAQGATQQQIVRKTLQDGGWRGEIVNYSSDGTEIIMDARTKLVKDEDGIPVSMLGIATDITDRKQAEKEKIRLEEQFHQAQKMESIGRLAGGIAHDLNNLLSPILGYTEIFLEGAVPEDSLRETMMEIQNAGIRARNLVRQLLAFSRRQTLQFQLMNVNELLKEFHKLLRRTIREDISIHMHLAPELPDCKGDMGQLEQVIMNLAVNAQDAMPGGGELTIETAKTELDENYAQLHRGAAPGAYVMLAISDTGEGMDAEIQSHLFEPFFTTKDPDRGTGLGLATSYGIIKQHGGNIWAYSEPGMGTTFKIYLPVSTTARGAGSAVSKRVSASGSGGSETILLVEDDRQVNSLASAVLQRQGYNVLSAVNGQEALSIVDRHGSKIRLLLTDVVMPDMNGRELFAQISGVYPHVRVLYMSGYTDDVIAHHGILDQGIDFIQKPFSIKTLAAKVREVLDNSTQ